MSEERVPYDVTQAHAAIDADRQARARQALARIQAVLEEERCQLVAVPQLTADGRVVAVVQVVAQ